MTDPRNGRERIKELKMPDPDLPRIIVLIGFVRGMGLVAYDAATGRILGFQRGVEATVSDYMDEENILSLQTAKIDIICDDRMALERIGLLPKDDEVEVVEKERCTKCGSTDQAQTSLTEDDPNLRLCGSCGEMYIVE